MRIDKTRYYLEIARSVAKRSPCTRRKVGAIIVRNDVIVSTGYNGPPRGSVNCDEVGCLKDLVKAPHGTAWEVCPAVHAEENAVINAARQGTSVVGGTMYVSEEYLVKAPSQASTTCQRCRRLLINAGIEKVVYQRSDGKIKEYRVKDWVKEDIWNYLKSLHEAERKKEA